MNAHAYTEDQLVEQPAIGLFAVLGWQTVSALEETFGAGGMLGRETRGEVVLVERLRAALCKFNPALPPEAISNAVGERIDIKCRHSPERPARIGESVEFHRAISPLPRIPDRGHGGTWPVPTA
ncbi:MAG: type restriction enzyme subunit [Pseudomonadota bacterium]|nr:type restriction enzyme subunit [Pseudomonadota bacterium]